MEQNLREWQKNAEDFLIEKNYKGIFVIPTGAGKTYFAIHMIKRFLIDNPNTRILIIVPTNVLISQWQEELRLNNLWLNKVSIYNGLCKEYSQIVLTTNASANKINYKIFDFLIFDEIHKAGTDNMLKILSSDNFKHKIGLTATPDREDSKHWEIFRQFDYNIFNYDIKQAIIDKVLNRFELINIEIEMDTETASKYRELTNSISIKLKEIGSYFMFMRLPNTDLRKQKLMGLINERKKLIWAYPKKLEIVCNLIHNFKSDRVLIFSQFNYFTNLLYYYLGSEGIKTGLLHSKINKKEREDNIEKFKSGELNVLLTTKVVDEGFNVPAANVGIITASEKIPRQMIQRLGRILRIKDDNTPSKLIQLYVKDTMEEEQAKTRTDFYKEIALSIEEVKVDG
jgi:superfamily II DNA or RNA helicase